MQLFFVQNANFLFTFVSYLLSCTVSMCKCINFASSILSQVLANIYEFINIINY